MSDPIPPVMTCVLNRNFYIRSPADVHSQRFVFSQSPTLQFFLFIKHLPNCVSYHSLRSTDEVEACWISLGPYPPSVSLSQADGIHSIDTIALMERGARALQVLHLLSEFAGLSVPIRVSEWQKDGGGMELSVRGMLVKMLVKKVESNKANDIGP